MSTSDSIHHNALVSYSCTLVDVMSMCRNVVFASRYMECAYLVPTRTVEHTFILCVPLEPAITWRYVVETCCTYLSMLEKLFAHFNCNLRFSPPALEFQSLQKTNNLSSLSLFADDVSDQEWSTHDKDELVLQYTQVCSSLSWIIVSIVEIWMICDRLSLKKIQCWKGVQIEYDRLTPRVAVGTPHDTLLKGVRTEELNFHSELL